MAAPNGLSTLGGTLDSAPRAARWSVAAAIAVAAVAIAAVQIEVYLDRGLSVDGALVAYLLVQAAILTAALVAVRLERRPFRDLGFVLRGPVSTTLLFSALLVLGFLLIELYPGFLFHFSRLPTPTVLAFGFALLSAPVAALAQETAFRGYVFRTLTRTVPFSAAMAISSALFAAQATALASFATLGTVGAGEYFFDAPVASLVLGLAMALLFYKSRWSLLAPVTTRTGLLWVGTLLPLAARFPNWETAFAALLLGYGVVFAVVALGIREPRLQARQYLGETIGPRRGRFLERARLRREVRSTVATVGVMAVVFVASTQVAPAVLGTTSPLLAIATGSMVPTLYRGTLVVVAHVAPSAIAVGTIIAFHVSCLPAPTVHRVHKILEGGSSPVYQTKGDANPSPDPCPVPYADVLGKVVAIVPYLGLLVLDPLLDGVLVGLAIVAALLVPGRGRWGSR